MGAQVPMTESSFDAKLERWLEATFETQAQALEAQAESLRQTAKSLRQTAKAEAAAREQLASQRRAQKTKKRAWTSVEASAAVPPAEQPPPRVEGEEDEAAEVKAMRGTYSAMPLEELQQLALQKGLPKHGRDKAGLVELLLAPDGALTGCPAVPEDAAQPPHKQATRSRKIEVSFTLGAARDEPVACLLLPSSQLGKGAAHWCKKAGLGDPSLYAFTVGARQVNLSETVGQIADAHGLAPGAQLEVNAERRVTVHVMARDEHTKSHVDITCHPGVSLRRVARGWAKEAFEQGETEAAVFARHGTALDMNASVRSAMAAAGEHERLEVEALPAAEGDS